jgi:hypothetical protein
MGCVSFTHELKALDPATEGMESPGGGGRISFMADADPNAASADRRRSGPPSDESRLLMMRRIKRMTVEQRLDLFERLSRRVTWARSAKRVR